MSIVNKYYYHSHISEAKFREITKLFSLDIPASKIAGLAGVNRVTINNIIQKIRLRLAVLCEEESPFSTESHLELHIEEHLPKSTDIVEKGSYGPIDGNIIFGILQREGKIYTEIVPDSSTQQLKLVIQRKIDLAAVIPSIESKDYDSLVDLSNSRYCRVNRPTDTARGNRYIDGVEAFWAYTKGRLAKFNGIPPDKFYLHLKECEYRYNHRHEKLYTILLREFRKNPL